MFKLVLEKAEEPENELPTSSGSSEKQESSRKTSIYALLTMPKSLTANKLENSERDGNTRPPYLSLEKSVCRSKQQLKLDMEQWIGSKLGKEYDKPVYCHPGYLTSAQYIMQNTGLNES